MQKSDFWHLVWVSVLVVAGGLLGITLLIALAYSNSSTFANVASIWGLFVGLIGFVVTIYTLFETQRISRSAQKEIQTKTAEAQLAMDKTLGEAQVMVKNAQEQIRQVLERARHAVRNSDFWMLQMWTTELRTATGAGNWYRALFLAEACPFMAERLRHAEGLEDSERQDLREGADNLRLLQAYIGKDRLKTEKPGLPPSHAKCVEKLVTLLERIGGRLHHEPIKG